MRMRIGALVGLLVVVVVVIAIGGYWYVKDRTRIGQASLQTKVAATEGGSRAACVKKDSNAAHWLCAVSIPRQPEKCIKAHVRPWGSVVIVDGFRKCRSDPTLAPLFQEKKKKHKKKHQSAA